ncbi:hypothetical protein C3K47_11675 [Solitalea longa]|uniref:Uncharacterized protein n=1 Tax=Solitalea longa TaxID=2079460 RepID=A0A2S5A270_9SPHI|nr:hypothetical protein C3K47_11675 [Solitalea longa]
MKVFSKAVAFKCKRSRGFGIRKLSSVSYGGFAFRGQADRIFPIPVQPGRPIRLQAYRTGLNWPRFLTGILNDFALMMQLFIINGWLTDS